MRAMAETMPMRTAADCRRIYRGQTVSRPGVTRKRPGCPPNNKRTHRGHEPPRRNYVCEMLLLLAETVLMVATRRHGGKIISIRDCGVSAWAVANVSVYTKNSSEHKRGRTVSCPNKRLSSQTNVQIKFCLIFGRFFAMLVGWAHK